jgi:hypothetical protein
MSQVHANSLASSAGCIRSGAELSWTNELVCDDVRGRGLGLYSK